MDSSASAGRAFVVVRGAAGATGGAGVGVARDAPLERGALDSSARTCDEARPTTEFRKASSSNDGLPAIGAGGAAAAADSTIGGGAGAGDGGTGSVAGVGLDVRAATGVGLDVRAAPSASAAAVAAAGAGAV